MEVGYHIPFDVVSNSFDDRYCKIWYKGPNFSYVTHCVRLLYFIFSYLLLKQSSDRTLMAITLRTTKDAEF